MNRGDFEAYFKSDYSRLVWMIIKLGGDIADAEDAVMEAMTLAYQHAANIESPHAWTRKVATRIFLKNAKARRDATSGAELPDVPEVDHGWELFGEQERAVLRAFGQLPQTQRAVAALSFDYLTTAEIAEALGITRGTVRSHLRHARRRLKEVFDLATDTQP